MMKISKSLLLCCFAIQLILPLKSYATEPVTAKVIAVACGSEIELLTISEGNFLNDHNFAPPEVTNIWHELTSVFQQNFIQNPDELLTYLKQIDRLKTKVALGEIGHLSAVAQDELLIDRSSDCTYINLAELSSTADEIQFSREFYLLDRPQQFAALFELVHLLETQVYNPVNFRNFIYARLTGNYFHLNQKQMITLHLDAGFDSFAIEKAIVDIKRKIRYDGDANIGKAYFKKGTYFHLRAGKCKASTLQPSIFMNGKMIRVQTSQNCPLTIGTDTYLTMAEEFIEIALAGHIDAIKLKANTRIKNKMVDLISSNIPSVPAKLIFSIDGSGRVAQYVQFLGKVWAFGSFKTFYKYTNLGIFFNLGIVDHMVLKEPFFYQINNNNDDNGENDKLELAGQTILNHFGTLKEARIIRSDTSIHIQSKRVFLKQGSALGLYPEKFVKTITLEKAIILKNTLGEQMKYYPGQVLTFDKLGFVLNYL